MKRFHLLFLLSVGFLLVTQCALATTLIVGTCRKATTHYKTISAAVAIAPFGATVEVCPATYAEQVVILESLNLVGLTDGTSGRVIIASPSGGVPFSFTSLIDGVRVHAQVSVGAQGGPVNITNITVDGTGNGVTADWLAGLAYSPGTSGTVNGVTAREQIGGTHGVGIWVENLGSPSTSVTIENSQIHDADNTGIFVRSKTSSADLTAKVIGNQMINMPFGIRDDAAGTVMGNVIADHTRTGIEADSLSTASILSNTISPLHGAVGVTGIQVGGTGEIVKMNTILAEVDGSATSIAINLSTASSATVEANRVTNTNIGIEFGCKTGNTVSGNTINDVGIGLAGVPTGLSVPGTLQNVDVLRTGGC